MFFLNKYCKYLVIIALAFVFYIASATVYVKTRSPVETIFDKLACEQMYTSELEVNGVPGTISVYTVFELNSINRLAQILKVDPSKISEDGFRVNLTKEQGGGMLFAIADKSGNISSTVIYISCPGGGSAKWLFPEINSPTEANLQFSVNDVSRGMRMCTYVEESNLYNALNNLKEQLSKNNWTCMTPGSASTCLFFSKDEAVLLVSAVPSSTVDGNCTILIMEKK